MTRNHVNDATRLSLLVSSLRASNDSVRGSRSGRWVRVLDAAIEARAGSGRPS